MGRGAGVQISDSIMYITGPEKCDEKLSDTQSQIGRELKYVTNDVKTLQGAYTGMKYITDMKRAADEMMQVKAYYKKTGGRVALHGIISVDEEESDKKNAGNLMCLISDLLDDIFPEHQAVYAVHANTENLHVHFIINTVGLDGKKIHMDKAFMRGVMEPKVNELAVKYGFTPNIEWNREKKRDMTPFAQRAMHLRKAIDLAIERSDDFDGFIKELKMQGIHVNCGKYLSLKEEGMSRAVRSHRLGSLYSLGMIRDRLLQKREELIRSEVGDHLGGVVRKPEIYAEGMPLKRYRDMTDEEKKKAIKMLKSGRNPWQERRRDNWLLKNMSDEFERTAGIFGLINIYAPDTGSAEDAMEKIVMLQKQIAQEKKKVSENLKKNRPVIELYKEAGKHAARAYLYEAAGREEFKEDHDRYRELSERLEKGYSKTMPEVAGYLEDQEAELSFARAQSLELSRRYKTIARFKGNELKSRLSEHVTLFDAIGFSKAAADARMGVFSTGMKYIAADGADGGFVRSVITPDVVDGRMTVSCRVTVFDADGKETDSFSSKDMDRRTFNRKIAEVKGQLGLYRCHSFDTGDLAKAFVAGQKAEKKKAVAKGG